MFFKFGFAILFLIISLVSIKTCKKIFNPVTVFCGLWTIIIFLSVLQLYDLKKSSYWTYFCIGIGVVFYIIGFYFDYNFFKVKEFKICIKKQAYSRKLTKTYEYKPNYKIIYPLVIILLFTKLFTAKKSILTLLAGGNLDTVLLLTRAASQDARGTIMNVIHNLLTGPFEFAIYPILAYNIFNKKHTILSGTILIILLLGIVSTGGRSNLIYLMVCLCVVFTFSNKNLIGYSEQIKKIKKNKRHFIILGVVFIISFVIISISRSGQKLFKHMYLYFAMQPVMFETWVDIVKEKGIWGFGIASFNGFTFHILYLLKNIFKLTYPKHWYDIFNMILCVDSDWKPITNSGLPANAYVSVFWYFYLDGREIGIIILSFIFGIISGHYFKNAVKRQNMKNICLYAIILFCIADTYVRIRFAVSDYVGGFLLLNFLLFKKYEVNNQFSKKTGDLKT